MIQQDVVQAKSRRPGSAGKRGARGNAIAPVPRVLQRCLASRCPHSSSQRLQQITTFVDKNHASLTFEALFLSAANLRGSNGRCHARFVREPVVQVFVDSSRVCAAGGEHTAGDTQFQRDAGLDLAPTDRSIPTAHIPRCEFPCTTHPLTRVVVCRKGAALGRDGTSAEACSHASKRRATDVPMKRSNPQLRQLRSSSFPARTIGPQSSDVAQAFRDFHVVSFPYCSGLNSGFH